MKRNIVFISCFILMIVMSSLDQPQQTQQQSQWTLVTLKEHYDYVLEQRDLKIDQKFQALEQAVKIANDAMNERFESVNEFRATLTDQQATFVNKSEYNANHASITSQLEDLKRRLDKYETLKQGGSTTLYIMIAIISFAFAIYAFARNFINKDLLNKKENE